MCVMASAAYAKMTNVSLVGAQSRDPIAAQLVAGMIQRGNLKPQALINILDQQVSTTTEQIARIALPILVVSGKDDADNGSAEGRAKLLPSAQAQRVPGTHMSAVNAPEFTQAIADFVIR
jgi:pimeloyl-ACP methyl ester carboxylesterase